MTDLVRGKVARIVNSRELIINRGSQSGVTLGMRFAVLNPAGEAVRDPDTGGIIGSLQRPKVQVEVVQLSDQMAVAQTYRHHSVNIGGAGVGQLGEIARLFAAPHVVRRFETLKASDYDWEPLTEEQSIVKVGDPVVQIEVSDEGEIGGFISGSAESVSSATGTFDPDIAATVRHIEGALPAAQDDSEDGA